MIILQLFYKRLIYPIPPIIQLILAHRLSCIPNCIRQSQSLIQQISITITMQILETPPLQRQKRSLSYNDLKKRRLMRSAHSHKKLQQAQIAAHTTTVKKGMSQAKSILSTIPRDERAIQTVITHLQGALGQLRNRPSSKKAISIRESLTERPSGPSEDVVKRAVWQQFSGGETKQLIKKLMNKNKSQRRLVKFNEVRDKFKQEKERSLSNSMRKSEIKAIPSPLKSHPNKQNAPDSSNPQPQLFNPDISCIPCNHLDNFSQSDLQVLQPQPPANCGSFLRLLNDQQLIRGCSSRQLRRRADFQRVRRVFPTGFF